jgi:hypothetical protein
MDLSGWFGKSVRRERRHGSSSSSKKHHGSSHSILSGIEPKKSHSSRSLFGGEEPTARSSSHSFFGLGEHRSSPRPSIFGMFGSISRAIVKNNKYRISLKISNDFSP